MEPITQRRGNSRCSLHPQDDSQLLTQVVPHVSDLEANLSPHVSIPRHQGKKDAMSVYRASRRQTLSFHHGWTVVSEFQWLLPAAGFQGELQVGTRLIPDNSALLRAHREAVTNTQSILCSAVTWLLGLREFTFHACCCYHNQAPQSILSTEAAASPQENETLELGKAASKFSSFFYIMLNVSKSLTPKYVNKHSTSFCLSGKINANFPPGGRREEVCVSWVNRIWCFRR